MKVGPITDPISTLGFHYNFISAEFNDYVGSQFDDYALVTVYGPKGSRTGLINTVNRNGNADTAFSLPRMPDDGDSYAGQTGWTAYTIANIDVGTPAYIVFTVADVADDVLSTILAVDDLSY
ncbi:hypothetical protein FACS1894137_19730 [Spirochaetia bacterium]|nr:hypothetical protein FACS1894137_19730 [Spirochaetia bacterium]